MAIYLVTGFPGTGKSTLAVSHAIERYARDGRRVVANFPIQFDAVCFRRSGPLSRSVVRVIPDRPSRLDLDLLGDGGESEERAGMLIVDEAGGWLNARSWQGGDREAIIDWLTQSRKRYWDIYLIAQSPSMLDKMVREAVCEMVVRVRRTDRKKVIGFSLPRMHIGVCRYGVEANGVVLERMFYTGNAAHKCFGSYRVFGKENAHYSVLPPTLSKWRYIEQTSAWERFMRQMGLRPRRVAAGPGDHLKPKIPLISLIERLPPSERVWHWWKLARLGAF